MHIKSEISFNPLLRVVHEIMWDLRSIIDNVGRPDSFYYTRSLRIRVKGRIPWLWHKDFVCHDCLRSASLAVKQSLEQRLLDIERNAHQDFDRSKERSHEIDLLLAFILDTVAQELRPTICLIRT